MQGIAKACLVVLCFVMAAEAIEFSIVLPKTTLIAFTVGHLSVGVQGFFGIFRRRGRPTPAPAMISNQEYDAPTGPVSSAFPFFPGRPGGLFQNPFQFGGNLVPNFLRQQSGGGFFQQRPDVQRMNFQQQLAQEMASQQIPSDIQQQVFQQMDRDFDSQQGSFSNFQPESRSEDSSASASLNTEEAESFFTLLAETDEGGCISRLVCEIGADPVNSGEFGQTISEIISNLRDMPPNSKAAQYNEILLNGVRDGLPACASRFLSCDDESLRMVKNAQMSDSQQ